MLSEEELQEIREQKKIDRAEDDRDLGPEGEEIDQAQNAYERMMGW